MKFSKRFQIGFALGLLTAALGLPTASQSQEFLKPGPGWIKTDVFDVAGGGTGGYWIRVLPKRGTSNSRVSYEIKMSYPSTTTESFRSKNPTVRIVNCETWEVYTFGRDRSIDWRPIKPLTLGESNAELACNSAGIPFY